jgi:hypothetical protein
MIPRFSSAMTLFSSCGLMDEISGKLYHKWTDIYVHNVNEEKKRRQR